MNRPASTAMDASEIHDFLESRRTGVLSLGKGDDSYSIPVSFAYDDTGPSVYLRLGDTPESREREYVDAADLVSFVVHDHTDEGWKSVVGRGRIEEVSNSSLETAITEAMEGLDIPNLRMFDGPTSNVEFTLTRIEISELNGIAEREKVSIF